MECKNKIIEILKKEGFFQPFSDLRLCELSGYDIKSVRQALLELVNDGIVDIEKIASKRLYSLSPKEYCAYCGSEINKFVYEWVTNKNTELYVCKKCNDILEEQYGENDMPEDEKFKFINKKG